MPAEQLVTLGWSAISWIEHYLVHGPGDVQGQRIEMDDEFAGFVVKAYRLDPVSGRRRVKRGFLSRSKGRSKSEIAGWVGCFEALGPCRFDHWAQPGEVSEWGYEYEPGEPVGRPLTYVEVLCAATEEGQAGNTYDVIHYNLDPQTCSPELAEDYPGLDVGLTRITLPDARGEITPETAGDSSKDGGKSTFIVADETHLWILPRLKRMHATMARNLLKRKAAQGWMLETSTMYGEGEDSVAEGTHSYAKQVRSGARRDSSLLFDHRQASTHWDLNDREQRLQALAEAYGPAAAWMPLDDIADYWDDPQVTEAEFRRYWLNQPVPMLVQTTPGVIQQAAWNACRDVAAAIEGPPTLALDVSPNLTHSAIVAAGPVGDGRTGVEVTSDGAALVDYREGTAWAVELLTSRRAEVWMAPGSAAEAIRSKLEAGGCVVHLMERADYARACVNFAAGVASKTIVHRGQDVLDKQVTAGAKRAADEGLWTWGRVKSSTDITLLVAATVAVGAAEVGPETDYVARGVLTV